MIELNAGVISEEPAAVIRPLPFTVKVEACVPLPNDPTFELTVAKVVVIVEPVVPDAETSPLRTTDPEGIETAVVEIEVMRPLESVVITGMALLEPKVPAVPTVVSSNTPETMVMSEPP